MAHWLLQHNPGRGPCAGAEGGDWVIRRHRETVALGDDVALWLSGRTGGVIAVGSVSEPPHPGPDGTVIGVSVTRSFPCIPRAALLADDRFAGSLIARMPAGGNPFPLTTAEWQAVAERVP